MTLGAIGSGIYTVGKIAIVGAFGAKAGEIVSKKIEAINPFKIISKLTPQCVKDSLKSGLLHQTLGLCNEKVALFFKSQQLGSVIGAPIIEEAVFRAGIQTLITSSLSYTMDAGSAELMSILLTNIMFSMAHGKDIDSLAGTDLWFKGAAFSAAYSSGGYLAAVAAHMINNIRQNYMPTLSNLFSDSSGLDDLAAIASRHREEMTKGK